MTTDLMSSEEGIGQGGFTGCLTRVWNALCEPSYHGTHTAQHTYGINTSSLLFFLFLFLDRCPSKTGHVTSKSWLAFFFFWLHLVTVFFKKKNPTTNNLGWDKQVSTAVIVYIQSKTEKKKKNQRSNHKAWLVRPMVSSSTHSGQEENLAESKDT